MVAHAFHPSTQEAEVGRSEFSASQDYYTERLYLEKTKSCPNKTKQKNALLRRTTGSAT